MATPSRRRRRRSVRFTSVAKPAGSLHPRVQLAQPEHFGIVAIDCAKARFKWMLADFYGRILVPPTLADQTRQGFQDALAALRHAQDTHQLRDLVVAIERTGAYHKPVQRAYAAAGYETRIVHPLTTHEFRKIADPGNKTDDTDLLAIVRATVNGFGLLEPPRDPLYIELQLLARHRRDLVIKNAALRNQIHVELDALFPGLAATVGDIFDCEPAWVIVRHTRSAQEIRALGREGLVRLLEAQGVRFQRRTLEKILAWAERAPEAAECQSIHKRILECLDDERRRRLDSIQALERDLAALLVQTPYVLLLSFPGINVVSAAEFAGEMGPIANYPHDGAITGRAGLFPSRSQSDQVDHADGPLVSQANHALRYIILLIAENLLTCNAYFRGLGAQWQAAGVDRHMQCVRAAKRFCRIAYQMVAGRQVFRHPSCRPRHKILEKLINFHIDHDLKIHMMMHDLNAALEWIPPAEYATEAEPLQARLAPSPRRGPAAAAAPGLQAGPPPAPSPSPSPAPAKPQPRPTARPQATSGRPRGPRPLSAILPEVLVRLGVTMVQSNPKGETDLT
jgi:transposase